MNLVRDVGLHYLHYTIHFLDMQLSLSITQSISKLPKSSTSGSFCQSYSSVSSSSSSSKRRSSSVTGMSSRMSCWGANVAAVIMMSSSWRATCTVAMSPTVWILMFWTGVIGFYKSINFKAECGEKDYDGIVCDVAFYYLYYFSTKCYFSCCQYFLIFFRAFHRFLFYFLQSR